MADVTITGLPNAATLTGTERVPMDQGGATVDAPASAIAALATKATVGLGNADNTSDASKPISAATQTALDGKAPTGPISSSGLTMTAGILGRESGTGAPQVFTLGSGLAIVSGALVVTGGGGGGYPSLSMPTGFGVSGSGTASLGVTFAAGYSLPLDSSQANWNTAFSERLRWDGSNTGLNAATARTSLGLGTLATQSGTFSGTSSGTNTGDNAVNALYSDLVSNANHTGDATGSSVLTLATVNAGVGSFGSATAAPTLTVNAKGLVTAASSTTITPAVSSITGLGTGVATALAANVGSVGAPVVLGGAGGTPSGLTLTNATGLPLAAGVTGILPVANGGTGATAPGLVAGANISISGTWPNQTISASAEGAVTAVAHGSNASTARPSGVTAVYWLGTVEPANAVNGDLWIGGI